MRHTNSETMSQIAQVKGLMERGFSLTKASETVGMNVGLAYYHMKKIGVPVRARDAKTHKLDNRILNTERRGEAKYFLDSCQLHILPLRYSHERASVGIHVLCAVSKPNRIEKVQIGFGEPKQNDWIEFLKGWNVPAGTVLLSDVGAEFCGAFAAHCKLAGLVLCRLRGWDDYRKQTKPWVESVFGEFQNVMRQNLAEYVPLRNKKPNWDDSDLDFVSFFGETNRLLESFVKTKSPEVKPIVINPTEVSNK